MFGLNTRRDKLNTTFANISSALNDPQYYIAKLLQDQKSKTDLENLIDNYKKALLLEAKNPLKNGMHCQKVADNFLAIVKSPSVDKFIENSTVFTTVNAHLEYKAELYQLGCYIVGCLALLAVISLFSLAVLICPPTLLIIPTVTGLLGIILTGVAEKKLLAQGIRFLENSQNRVSHGNYLINFFTPKEPPAYVEHSDKIYETMQPPPYDSSQQLTEPTYETMQPPPYDSSQQLTEPKIEQDVYSSAYKLQPL